ncbi:MAG: hypothetical protein ACI3Y5_07590 [Prevotella sp.]
MEKKRQEYHHPICLSKQLAKLLIGIMVLLGNTAVFAASDSVEVPVTPKGSAGMNPKPSRAPANIPVPFTILYDSDTHIITIKGLEDTGVLCSLYTNEGFEVVNVQYEIHENGDITIDNPNFDGFTLNIEYRDITYVATYSQQ